MLTKNDMARNIVAALYNLPKLPAANDPRVTLQTRKQTAANLRPGYELAQRIINKQLSEGTHPSQ